MRVHYLALDLNPHLAAGELGVPDTNTDWLIDHPS
jgi:hypothetical protein